MICRMSTTRALTDRKWLQCEVGCLKDLDGRDQKWQVDCIWRECFWLGIRVESLLMETKQANLGNLYVFIWADAPANLLSCFIKRHLACPPWHFCTFYELSGLQFYRHHLSISSLPASMCLRNSFPFRHKRYVHSFIRIICMHSVWIKNSLH